ncbi:MAG: histidine kinase [Saprospiraceae bacterium]
MNARHEIEKEIRFLEKSALQSQMNPHFIFNCLNSIQSFIIQNDKEQAMEYLGMFASLIRQYLRASNSTFITLYDECQMLRNYLELESLRCNYSLNIRLIMI